jgi:tetratricopeptide (TPR) repeat protein
MTDKFQPPVPVKHSQVTAKVMGEIVFIVLFCGGTLAAFIWALFNLITGQYTVLSLMVMFLTFAVIPPCMEDAGVLLAHRKRLYHLGGTLLWGSHQISNTIYRWEKNKAHSMSAMRLAQLSLMQNDLSEALQWALESVKMSRRDFWFGPFYAHSVLGQVYYAMGEFEQAQEQFEIAETTFQNNTSPVLLQVLLEKMTKFSVVNRDLLARIELRNGEDARAANLFRSSYQTRNTIPTLQPMAEAFREYYSGLIAFQAFKVDEAQEHFARALHLIPDKVSNDYEQMTLAIEICTAATSHGAHNEDIALEACEKLGQLHAQGLHPRLLEMAAGSVSLTKKTDPE